MDQIYKGMRRNEPSWTGRRGGWLALRGVALAGAGLWLGTLASAWTSDRMKPLAPAALAREAEPTVADPGEAARSWARHAFGVGLRECPRVSEAFHAACAAQMAEETRLAAAAAEWQARYAAYEPPAYVPEPVPEPEIAPEAYAVEEAPGPLLPAIHVVGEPAPEDMDGIVEPAEIARSVPPVPPPPTPTPPPTMVSLPPAD